MRRGGKRRIAARDRRRARGAIALLTQIPSPTAPRNDTCRPPAARPVAQRPARRGGWAQRARRAHGLERPFAVTAVASSTLPKRQGEYFMATGTKLNLDLNRSNMAPQRIPPDAIDEG